jgi:CheY-like chemotaxis protein
MKKRILLIDDEVITLKTTKMLLGQRGFEVEAAQNTSEAISVLTSTTIDMILLDISMPTISGFDFIKLMKALRIDVPVVFLSNHTDEYTRKMAESEGVKRCINKGEEFQMLPQIVEELLSKQE